MDGEGDDEPRLGCESVALEGVLLAHVLREVLGVGATRQVLGLALDDLLDDVVTSRTLTLGRCVMGRGLTT